MRIGDTVVLEPHANDVVNYTADMGGVAPARGQGDIGTIIGISPSSPRVLVMWATEPAIATWLNSFALVQAWPRRRTADVNEASNRKRKSVRWRRNRK